MNPKRINTFHANTSDIEKKEVGEYWSYDLRHKIGDLVVLEIFPMFDDIMEQYEYIQKNRYPPDYLVLAEVTRLTNNDGFYCKVLANNYSLLDPNHVKEVE